MCVSVCLSLLPHFKGLESNSDILWTSLITVRKDLRKKIEGIRGGIRQKRFTGLRFREMETLEDKRDI